MKAVSFFTFLLLLIYGSKNVQAKEEFIEDQPAPPLIDPTQGATNVSVTPRLNYYSIVPGAVSYHYQVARDSAFSQIVVNDSIGAPGTPTVGPLLYGTKYYWRVNDKDKQGVTSDWSDVWHFTTAAATPINPTRASVQQLEIKSGNILQFSLSQKASVKIQIFDSKGAMVKTLVNETRGKGSYSIQLPAEFLAGYYLLDFTAGKFHKVIPIHGK